MKKISRENEIKLLEYIDGTLNADEAAALMRLVEEQPEMKVKLHELQTLNAYFAVDAIAQPAKNFTQRVMSRLDQNPRLAGLPIWKNVMLLVGIVLTAGIATWLVSLGMFDGTARIDLNSVILQKGPLNQSLPSLSFDGKMIVNAIIIFNLVIAFFLLDRTVLRPWFQRRSRLHF